MIRVGNRWFPEDEDDYPGPEWVEHAQSQLPFGPGHKLWTYWTKGKGLAKWIGAEHKWTTLHAALIAAGVPAKSADGLTTNIIQAVLPGYLKTNHKKK